MLWTAVPRTRRLPRWLLLLSLGGSTACGFGDAAPGEAASAQPLYQASFKDFDRVKRPLAEWQGRPLLVYFWATWCESCRRDVPELIRVYQSNRQDSLAVVGVAIDQTDNVHDFVKEYRIPYPMLVGGNDALALTRRLGNGLGGLPFFVAVDRRGRVVRTRLGEMPADTLNLLVRLAKS